MSGSPPLLPTTDKDHGHPSDLPPRTSVRAGQQSNLALVPYVTGPLERSPGTASGGVCSTPDTAALWNVSEMSPGTSTDGQGLPGNKVVLVGGCWSSALD